MRERIPYNLILKDRARELRKAGILEEALLWNQLKKKQLRHTDFHRQTPIDQYIVDFFAPSLKLAVEIDGLNHLLKGEYDDHRQRRLESFGIHVLRFWAEDVRYHMPEVILTIEATIDRLQKEME